MLTKNFIFKYFYYILTPLLVIFKYNYVISLKKGFLRILVLNFTKINQIKLKEFTNQCLYYLYLRSIFYYLTHFFAFTIHKYIPSYLLNRLWVFQKRAEKQDLELFFEYYQQSYLPPDPELKKKKKKKSFKLKLFGHIFSNIGHNELPLALNFYSPTFNFFFVSYGFVYFLIVITPGWLTTLSEHTLADDPLPMSIDYGNTLVWDSVNDFGTRRALANGYTLPNERFFNKASTPQPVYLSKGFYMYKSCLGNLNIFSKMITANFIRIFLYFEGLLLLHERVHFSAKFRRLLYMPQYEVFFLLNKEENYYSCENKIPKNAAMLTKDYWVDRPNRDKHLSRWSLLKRIREHFNRRYYEYSQVGKHLVVFQLRILHLWRIFTGSELLYKRRQYTFSNKEIFASLLKAQKVFSSDFQYAYYNIYRINVINFQKWVLWHVLGPLEQSYWRFFRFNDNQGSKCHWPVLSIFSLLFLSKNITPMALRKFSYQFSWLTELTYGYEITSFTTPSVFNKEKFCFRRTLAFSKYFVKKLPFIEFFDKGYVQVVLLILQYVFYIFTYSINSKKSFITKTLYSSLLPHIFSTKNQMKVNFFNNYRWPGSEINFNMNSSMFYRTIEHLYQVWFDFTYAYVYTSGIFTPSTLPSNKFKLSHIFSLTSFSILRFNQTFWGWTFGTWVIYFNQPNLVTKAGFLESVDFKVVYYYLLHNVKVIYTNFLNFFVDKTEKFLPPDALRDVITMKEFAFSITKYVVPTFLGRTESLNPFLLDHDFIKKEYISIPYYAMASVNHSRVSDRNFAFFSQYSLAPVQGVGFFVNWHFLLRYLFSYVDFIFFRNNFDSVFDIMDTAKYVHKHLEVSRDFFESMSAFAYNTSLIVRRFQDDDDLLQWSHSTQRAGINASLIIKDLENVWFTNYPLNCFTDFVDLSFGAFYSPYYFDLKEDFTYVHFKTGKLKPKFKDISWNVTRQGLAALVSKINPLYSLERYAFSRLNNLWLNITRRKNDPQNPIEFLFLNITYKSLENKLSYSLYNLYPYYYFPNFFLFSGLQAHSGLFRLLTYKTEDYEDIEDPMNFTSYGYMHKYFFLKFLVNMRLFTLLYWLDLLLLLDNAIGLTKPFNIPTRRHISFKHFFSITLRFGPLRPNSSIISRKNRSHMFPILKKNILSHVVAIKKRSLIKLRKKFGPTFRHFDEIFPEKKEHLPPGLISSRYHFYHMFGVNFLHFLKYKLGKSFYMNASLQVYTPFLLVFNVYRSLILLLFQYLQRVLFSFFN